MGEALLTVGPYGLGGGAQIRPSSLLAREIMKALFFLDPPSSEPLRDSFILTLPPKFVCLVL